MPEAPEDGARPVMVRNDARGAETGRGRPVELRHGCTCISKAARRIDRKVTRLRAARSHRRLCRNQARNARSEWRRGSENRHGEPGERPGGGTWGEG